jgi:signal transduction histidine kinase/ActR/RegA family two-component response regulator
LAKILVVDDEKVREVLKRYFEVAARWTVYTAANADDAIELIKIHGDELDGIVLDRYMPDRSGQLAYTGDDVVSYLFDHDLLSQICLIMLTGYGDVDITQKALSMGGWHFLEKPVAPRDIHRLLAPGIARKKSYRLRRTVLSGPSIDSVIDRIQGIVCETLAPDHFNVYFLEAGRGRNLTYGVAVDPNKRFVQHTLTHQSYLYAGTRKEAQEWGAMHENTGTLMAVRVEAYQKAEAVGVMVMESHEEGAFDPRWHEVLSYLADLIGFSLTIGRVWQQKAEAEQESLRLLNKELKHRLATSTGTMLQHIDSLESDLGSPGASRENMLAKAKTVKRHLSSLVQVMKELGEVSTSFSPRIEVCDPAAIAQQVLAEKLQGSGIHHSLNIEEDSLRFKGDRELLSYCLECIVHNALEAVQENQQRERSESEPDFVALVDEAAKKVDITVSIRKSGQPGMGEIRIKDEGVGFDEEIRLRLFNPLFTTKLLRGNETRDRGIGLYSAKKLIAAMNGSVDAQSQGRGQGAEFVIRLPLAEQGVEE